MPSRSKLFFALATIFVALAVAVAAFLLVGGQRQGYGVALVGGPFTLTDQNGKRVTEKDFAGKYMLVFFGYTSCPDICPAGLQVMTAAMEKLGPLADDVQPVFITIDPARDTPEVLKEYASNFHPRLAALTGSEADIAAAARAYRVFYGKPKGEEGKADYLMDHTAIHYVMGRDGKFLTHISYGTNAATFAAKIKSAIGAD